MAISAKKQIFILMISVSIILSFIITFIGQWSPALAQNADINLIGQNSTWRPFSAAIVIQNDTSLEILVASNHTDKTFNRAYLPMRISSSNATSIPFTLEYASKSNLGNATFQAQVRDNSSKVLWTDYLDNSGGQLFNKTFTLPSSILNRPVEFRFNVVTNGTGEHTLEVKKAIMSLSNVTQPIKVEYETAMDQAETVVSTGANETANATETAMDQAETVVSTGANETANATETASNQTGNPVLDSLKNIFGGIMGNN